MTKFCISVLLTLIFSISLAQSGKNYLDIHPPKNKSYTDSLYRFGHEIEVSRSISEFDYSNDGKVQKWTCRIAATGATLTSLMLNDLDLSLNGELFFYSSDLKTYHGGFKEEIQSGRTELGLPIILSDSVIIEYRQPLNDNHAPNLSLFKVIYGFKELGEVVTEEKNGFGSSGNCQINALCEQSGWCNQINSVGVIFNGGMADCSGALINNSDNDLTPYFLTAEHCVWGNPAYWVVYFNYQSESCDPSVDGRLIYYLSGLQLRASHEKTDYALLEFYSDVPYSYNPFFSGWSAGSAKPESGAAIHHPRGDVKKISLYSEKPSRVLYDADEGDPSNTKVKTWEVNFDSGTSESGSSGCPLFNENGRIVGQLTGYGDPPGTLACDREKHMFGRFKQTMNRGARAYLDPGLIKETTIAGKTPDQCPSNRTLTSYVTNGYHKASDYITTSGTTLALPGSDVFIEAGSRVFLNPGFHAKSNSNAHIRIKPCSLSCANYKNFSEEVIDEADSIEFDKTMELTSPALLKVFPNPSNAMANIQFSANQFEYLVLINSLGQIVFCKNLESNDENIQLNLAQFPQGIYTVRCSGINLTAFQSLVIMR